MPILATLQIKLEGRFDSDVVKYLHFTKQISKQTASLQQQQHVDI